MKQPELGKKISEMRKAKGLTQEELVEKCNLNVRTIQRIEAGEVTPRSYTIKALFEALGMDLEEKNDKKIETLENDFPQNLKHLIYFSCGAGVIYFLLSMTEFRMERVLMNPYEIQDFGMNFYYAVKVASVICFTFFMIAFIKVAVHASNISLKFAGWVMIISNVMGACVETFTVQSGEPLISTFSILYVGYFGLVYLFLGYSFIQFESPWKSIIGPLGVLGMVTGVLFISVIGAIFGILTQAVFDLASIYFLMWYVKKSGRTSSPDSTFNSQVTA
ncbi:helix-turn-helix transcriptional regulator [uncultured Algoriphagus sp.]|uniref:helix-turn-helix domain-containing protein n=1 Tax=uncultured Algoriphagus sp. TaxID=417365 RepID=UPI0030EDD35E